MFKIRHNVLIILVIFSFDVLVLSKISRPKGVSLEEASLYVPTADEKFLCLDGLKSINFHQVNDDFCDCADSSDEPGTSACPNGSFHCVNNGYRPKDIPSSRVNDGVCDCCDASDEYTSEVKCIDICNELGREEREREKSKLELFKKGAAVRKDLSSRGVQLKSEREIKISELKTKLKEAESIREEKEKLKKEAEALENEALQIYKEAQEAEKQANLEKEAEENRHEAEETFARFDSDKNGLINYRELQTVSSLDKDRNSVVSEEEAKYFLDNNEEVDKETFISIAWPKIKPFLMLDKGLFQPPRTEEEQENKEEAELLNENDGIRGEGEEEEEDEDLEGEHIGDDVNEDGDEDEEEHTDTDSHLEPQEYDPETQKLIEQANGARNQFSEADRTVREIETELREIDDLMKKDYGVEEEFAPLDGECFNYDDREYVYRLCPFDRASQQPRSGGGETRLGTWDIWVGKEYKYSHMMYNNGASCWNGPQRSALVTIECGLENHVTSVTEPNRCEYHFVFETPAACHLGSKTTSSDVHDEL